MENIRSQIQENVKEKDEHKMQEIKNIRWVLSKDNKNWLEGVRVTNKIKKKKNKFKHLILLI